MILLFTGDGEGKTSAAIGKGIRALGQGKKVLMIQFIKSKKWPTGEEKTISQFGQRFRLIKGGKGFVKIWGDKLPFKVHKRAAIGTFKKAEEAIFSKKFNLIILDEINQALFLKLISKKKVLELLSKIPKELDLILTGRKAPEELIKIADLVTIFQEIKHPFKKRILAKKGIEY